MRSKIEICKIKVILKLTILLMAIHVSLPASSAESTEVLSCDISEIEINRPNLIFTGPLSINEANLQLEENVFNYNAESLRNKWVSFREIALNQENACIYYFNSEEESWNALSGMRGFVLVASGDILQALIIARS